MSNINQTILTSIMSKESIPSSSLKAVYDWKLPSDNNAQNVITQNNLIFNSLYSVSDHLADADTLAVSTKYMPAFSVGTANNILTHDDAGTFSGNDVMYIPQTKLINNWTMFLDLQINVSQNKNKSTVLLTNKSDVEDDAGWIFGINGAGFLFFRFKNKNGGQSIKTFFKLVKGKSLIAVSKSKEASSLSIYVYNPVLNTVHEKTFTLEEPIPLLRNWCVGGAYTSPPSSTRYENFSGEINNIVLFDSSFGKEKSSSIFESLFITSFTAEHTEDVATEFPRPGKYVEVEVRDGVKVEKYVDKEVEITTASGGTITAYDKVPIYTANIVKKLQFINGVGTTTKMIPTLVPELKTKDAASARNYISNEYILLNEDVDITEYSEVYYCDEYFDNINKVATFVSGDSTFKLDKVYGNQDELQIYLNGLLLEKDIDYQINGQKIKKIKDGLFVETDDLVYDIYEADKIYYDFFGYNGTIWLYGMAGRDVFSNGKKLTRGVDYEDHGSSYLKIYSSGLPSGRLGIVSSYSNVTNKENFRDSYLHGTTNVIFNEMVWIGNKKAVSNLITGVRSMPIYLKNEANNLNNSGNLAAKKTTAIYNNEENLATWITPPPT